PFPQAPFVQVAKGVRAAIENTARRLRAAGTSWVYASTARDAIVVYLAIVERKRAQRHRPGHVIGCLIVRADELGAELNLSPMVRMRAVRLLRLANVLRVQFCGGWVDGRPSRTKSRFLLSCYQATRATLSHDTTHTLSTGSGAKGGTLRPGSGANKIYRREIQDQKRTDPADGSRTVAAVGQKPAMHDNPHPHHQPTRPRSREPNCGCRRTKTGHEGQPQPNPSAERATARPIGYSGPNAIELPAYSVLHVGVTLWVGSNTWRE